MHADLSEQAIVGGLTVALVGAAREAGMGKRFAPLLAIGIGASLGAGFRALHTPRASAIVEGALAGAIAGSAGVGAHKATRESRKSLTGKGTAP